VIDFFLFLPQLFLSFSSISFFLTPTTPPLMPSLSEVERKSHKKIAPAAAAAQ
jgi:hypothetical protein